MRKAVKGQIHHFVWDPPQPYSGSPTLTVGFSAPLTDELFTQSRADVSVTAIANDRRTLTLSASVATQLQRDEVKAFLKTTRDTYYAVKVSRIGGTTAVLAEPLPRELDLTAAATLNFSMSYKIAPRNKRNLRLSSILCAMICIVSVVPSRSQKQRN